MITFHNNSKAIEEIKKEIRKAKHSILIKAFLWRDDKVGNEIAREIKKAANRDVKVLILKDRIGAFFEFAEGSFKSFFHNKSELKTVYLQAKLMRKFYNKKPNK